MKIESILSEKNNKKRRKRGIDFLVSMGPREPCVLEVHLSIIIYIVESIVRYKAGSMSPNESSVLKVHHIIVVDVVPASFGCILIGSIGPRSSISHVYTPDVGSVTPDPIITRGNEIISTITNVGVRLKSNPLSAMVFPSKRNIHGIAGRITYRNM